MTRRRNGNGNGDPRVIDAAFWLVGGGIVLMLAWTAWNAWSPPSFRLGGAEWSCVQARTNRGVLIDGKYRARVTKVERTTCERYVRVR